MSGIVGCWYLDGRSAASETIGQMVQTIAHRGPDGTAVWFDGPIGLGHVAYHTTPEAHLTPLPAAYPGGLTITGDARLDNRDYLYSALRPDQPLPSLSDSDLIVAAYQRWGRDCPAHLVGDFAFAIWDTPARTLFCARDHLGIRPFFYYHDRQQFAFGSEVKALWPLSIPRRPNRLRIAYHLLMVVEDQSLTFYDDVWQLPPAHSLTVTPDGISLNRYWSLDPTRTIRLESDEAYASAFRHHFTEAVISRLRGSQSVGLTLSGGLDSSAIACVAAPILAEANKGPLHTVSAVYQDFPECDERPYIEAVLAQGGMNSRYLFFDDADPLSDWSAIVHLADEPHTSPTFYLMWQMNAALREQGVGVVLDGIDGDTAVSHGDAYLAELARDGDWQTFVAEARALSQHSNMPDVRTLFRRYGEPQLRQLAQAWRWLTFARHVANLSHYDGIPQRRLWRRYGLPALWPTHLGINGSSSKEPADSLLRPGLVKQLDLEARTNALLSVYRSPRPSEREDHYLNLTSGVLSSAFGLAQRAAAGHGMEARHPFSDRRLLEFCLALPPQQKLGQGWTRLILRRGLDKILPPEIQWRGGKTVNSPVFTEGLRQHARHQLAPLLQNPPAALKQYVNRERLQHTFHRYLAGDNSVEMQLWPALTLALWLQEGGI